MGVHDKDNQGSEVDQEAVPLFPRLSVYISLIDSAGFLRPAVLVTS